MAVPRVGGTRLWLSWTGLETDLIFNKGLELPGFAAFPLLESEEGRGWLRAAYAEQLRVAERAGVSRERDLDGEYRSCRGAGLWVG